MSVPVGVERNSQWLLIVDACLYGVERTSPRRQHSRYMFRFLCMWLASLSHTIEDMLRLAKTGRALREGLNLSRIHLECSTELSDPKLELIIISHPSE